MYITGANATEPIEFGNAAHAIMSLFQLQHPRYHTALLFRSILLLIVIVAQMVIPAAGQSPACNGNCGGTMRADVLSGTESHSCHEEQADSDCSHHPDAGNTSKHRQAPPCSPYDCSCCTFTMLPGRPALPERTPLHATLLCPARLGEIITHPPIPPEQPPC